MKKYLAITNRFTQKERDLMNELVGDNWIYRTTKKVDVSEIIEYLHKNEGNNIVFLGNNDANIVLSIKKYSSLMFSEQRVFYINDGRLL